MVDHVAYCLPLAPFEEYMLIDDRPTHPMTFFLRLRFSGRRDTVAFDAALRAAVRRHPLLEATIRKSDVDRFNWLVTYEHEPTVRWMADSSGDVGLGLAAIDLFHEPGLRVMGRCRDGATELLFQFHHSCCDAIGALRFIEDFLVALAAGGGDDTQSHVEPGSWRPIEVQRLLGRSRFGLTRWKLLRMAHKQAVGLLGARQFLMRRPVPVQPVAAESIATALPADFPAACAHEFTESETAKLVSAARDSGTTVNNLLIRSLFLALGDFRSRRQLGDGSEWLRLSIPMNLRAAEDELLPAANVVSMIFLDRRPHEFADQKTLLAGIDAEMNLIKKNQLGLTFPLSLRFTRSLPGAISRMRRMSKKEVCRGTAVLSNLVRPLTDAPLPRRDGRLVAGDLTLEQIEFLPPVRPHTLAAFGVLTYAARLNVTLHFDPRGLTEQDAAELLSNFVDRVVETI